MRDQFLDADGIISPENYNKMKEIQDAIDIADESVCLRLGAKVDNTGKVTYYKYGSDGKVLTEPTTINGKTKNVPRTWSKE